MRIEWETVLKPRFMASVASFLSTRCVFLSSKTPGTEEFHLRRSNLSPFAKRKSLKQMSEPVCENAIF